jgi:hypothetical protein
MVKIYFSRLKSRWFVDTLPQACLTSALLGMTRSLQTTALAAIRTGRIRMDMSGALQIFKHCPYHLGRDAQPNSQGIRFQCSTSMDFVQQLFEHGYNPMLRAI